MTTSDTEATARPAEAVLAEIRRIRRCVDPSSNAGDAEDIITYAKHVIALRAAVNDRDALLAQVAVMREALECGIELMEADEGDFESWESKYLNWLSRVRAVLSNSTGAA